MNNGTTVALNADPNGDLTITNLDGTITIRKDGTVSISTRAPLELTGETLGKLDAAGVDGAPAGAFMAALLTRGKR